MSLWPDTPESLAGRLHNPLKDRRQSLQVPSCRGQAIWAAIHVGCLTWGACVYAVFSCALFNPRQPCCQKLGTTDASSFSQKGIPGLGFGLMLSQFSGVDVFQRVVSLCFPGIYASSPSMFCDLRQGIEFRRREHLLQLLLPYGLPRYMLYQRSLLGFRGSPQFCVHAGCPGESSYCKRTSSISPL